jgi:uncharacterized protein (DUF2225 family)
VACPAVLYFSTLLNKRHDFRKKERKKERTKERKKVTERKISVAIFSTIFV